MATWTLTVNDTSRTLEAEPDMPLLWALRDLLNLTGTKFGCGIGLCAACVVLLDGEAVRSCVTPVSAVGAKAVTTIEGLSQDGQHPVQKAWVEGSVSQCGYCQPGKILTAVALLSHNPRPTEAEIDEAFADNLCRCGTYLRIRQAILRAVEGA